MGGRNVMVAATHQWSRDTRTAANGATVVLLSHTVTLRRQSDRSVLRAPTTRWTALVRVGDLVAEVTPDEAVAARLPDLALVAAARLCVAANPGC